MRAALGSTVRQQSVTASTRDRLPGLLVALWACLLISVPIVRWTLGDAVLPLLVSATVAVLACAMFLLLVNALGLRSGATTAGIILVAAWLIEFVGSATGLPFGEYRYTRTLQPQIGGVPIIIPIAWLMMLPPAWAVGAAVAGRNRGARYVAFSALAFAAWDLFLDPQMVAWASGVGISLAATSASPGRILLAGSQPPRSSPGSSGAFGFRPVSRSRSTP